MTDSRGVEVAEERVKGMSRAAAAEAVAVSASGWSCDCTPMGATMRGVGSVRPNSETEASNAASSTPRSIEGTTHRQ